MVRHSFKSLSLIVFLFEFGCRAFPPKFGQICDWGSGLGVRSCNATLGLDRGYKIFHPNMMGTWSYLLEFRLEKEKLARLEGLEPPTLGSEDRCSIHWATGASVVLFHLFWWSCQLLGLRQWPCPRERIISVINSPTRKQWDIQPRNGSWAQKSRVRYWCAWRNTKSLGHLGGDETFLYCGRCAKSLGGLLWSNCCF